MSVVAEYLCDDILIEFFCTTSFRSSTFESWVATGLSEKTRTTGMRVRDTEKKTVALSPKNTVANHCHVDRLTSKLPEPIRREDTEI